MSHERPPAPKRRRLTPDTREAQIAALAPAVVRMVRALDLSAEGLTLEDFVSEGYVALVEAVDEYRAPHARRDLYGLEQWVKRRVRCHLIDAQRYYGARKRRVGTASIDEWYAERALPFHRIDTDAVEVRLAVEKLPKLDRLLIQKRFYDGWTEPDIARWLTTHSPGKRPWTVDRVRYRFARAYERLRVYLSQTPEEPS